MSLDLANDRTAARPLTLVLYDRTCRGRVRPGLSTAWWLGTALYHARDRVDASFGAASWEEGLSWLATVEPHAPIRQIQFWGHGKWGQARVDRAPLDRRALAPTSPLAPHLAAIRERMTALEPTDRGGWWFRTCETLGAEPGQSFAAAWADFFDAPVAGHTHIIGFWQSGLRRLHPGERPDWSPMDGLKKGTAANPQRASLSTPFASRTISCLRSSIPAGW